MKRSVRVARQNTKSYSNDSTRSDDLGAVTTCVRLACQGTNLKPTAQRSTAPAGGRSLYLNPFGTSLFHPSMHHASCCGKSAPWSSWEFSTLLALQRCLLVLSYLIPPSRLTLQASSFIYNVTSTYVVHHKFPEHCIGFFDRATSIVS